MELSQSQLSDIIQMNPGDFGIYRLKEGRFETLYVSPSLAEYAGMTEDEYRAITASDALQIVFANDRNYVSKTIGDAIMDGFPHDIDYQYRIIHKDKTAVWVHNKARMIGTMNGSPVLLSVFTDISSEADGFTTLLDHEQNKVYVVAKDTYELLYANAFALDSWDCHDYAGKQCHKLIYDRDTPCPWCSIPLIRNGEAHVPESYVSVTDRWYKVDISTVCWFGREAVETFISDITEQKKRQDDLVIDRDSLRNIISNIPMGIAVSHVTGNKMAPMTVNAPMCDILGVPPTGFITPSKSLADLIYEDDRETALAHMRSLTEPGMYRECLFRLRRKKAEEPRWFHLRSRTTSAGEGIVVYSSLTDVTDEERARADAERNRRIYESAVEAANLTVWEYDLSTRVVTLMDNEVTREFCKKYGIPEVIDDVPDSLVDLVDEPDRAAFLAMYEAVANGAPTASCEFWYRSGADVPPRCSSVTCTTMFDKDGKPVSVLGVDRDITDRKKAEEDYNRAYQTLADTYPNTLASFHLNLTTNWCGDGYSKLDFVMRQQESGTADGYFKEFAKLIADDDVRKQYFKVFTRENLLKLFREGQTQISIEYPIMYPNDELLWREGLLCMVQNPTTGDVEAVTYAIDIDEQKKAREIAQRVLDEKCDFVALLFPRTGEVEFRSVHWDVPCPTLERFDYEEGMRFSFEHFAAPEEQSELVEQTRIERVVDALAESDTYVLTFERRAPDTAPSRKQLQYSWLNERQHEVIIVQTDITISYQLEQRQLERTREALREAEEANNAKSDFLSRMSHDIRTPMNGIIGMSRIAHQYDNPPETVECLDKIDTSSQFLLGLVNDILDISKVESGKIELHREPYPPQEFFDYLDALIKPLCEEKGITFTVEQDVSRDFVPLLDKLRMNQVFFNLLSNAVKFTPEGGTITLRSDTHLTDDNKVLIQSIVSDTGVGMGKEFLDHLFEPFAQEERTVRQNTQSSGLGLAIVKNIVDLSGGTISVESEPGKGSTFTIRCPVDYILATEMPKAESAVAHTVANLAGKHILLCEDHPINIEIANHALEEEGMIVTIAEDGKLGVAAFEESPVDFYDAILMDVRMPVMDGLEATRIIRALDRADAASVPIIAMTANAYDEDVRECLDAGMNAHLPKPFEPGALYDVLASQIGQRPPDSE